jgi:hypothetical protein
MFKRFRKEKRNFIVFPDPGSRHTHCLLVGFSLTVSIPKALKIADKEPTSGLCNVQLQRLGIPLLVSM